MTGGGWWIACCCGLLLVGGLACHQQEQQRTVLARVGTAELNLSDALAQFDSTAHPSDDELYRFASHWINEELLYQEAQRRGFDKSDQFSDMLRDARRHLLVQAFLDREINDDTSGLTDSTLRAYYLHHSAEFVAQDDMIKVNIVSFSTR